MRPVDNRHVSRIADVELLTTAAAAIGTDEEVTWDEFLREHAGTGDNLRTGLWAVGSMKCWFSEALLQQGEGHIEHFRPKGRLSGDRHEGYKWRTFDWRNLRLAHSTVNIRRTDFLKKRKMGKGSYFPLRDPSRRATNAAQEIDEEPVLLDPVIASDTLLICFDEASGAPTPRYKEADAPWLNRRATESIDFYHLNEGTWNFKRVELMATVRVLCEQLEVLARAQARNDAEYFDKIDKIVAYINPFSEFSSACLQVVQERGLLEHFAPGLR
jgi:hypothetical protein